MPQKTKQAGVRLTDEEAEFLAGFKAQNAATPSDKLRAIIDDARLSDWVAECMAYLIASNGNEQELDSSQLVEVEAAIAQRVVVLIQSVLQLAVTKQAPLYDSSVLRDGIEPVLELAAVVNGQRQQTG